MSRIEDIKYQVSPPSRPGYDRDVPDIGPIFAQWLGYRDPSEARIQVTWSLTTNQRPVLVGDWDIVTRALSVPDTWAMISGSHVGTNITSSWHPACECWEIRPCVTPVSSHPSMKMPAYWPLIGPKWSCDLDSRLWLAISDDAGISFPHTDDCYAASDLVTGYPLWWWRNDC